MNKTPSSAIYRPTFLFLLALAALAGCDYARRREIDKERSQGAYRAAMTDYTAGRLEAAEAGFEKVIRADPGNASARFQLACLLQDRRHDYLGAIAQYREYLLLEPESDKAAAAKKRCEACERFYSAAVVTRAGKTDAAAVVEELEKTKKAKAEIEKKAAKLEKDLDAANLALSKAKDETSRVKALMTGMAGAEERTTPPPKTDVTALLDDDTGDGIDRVKFSRDVKELVSEEDDEKKATPFAVTEKKPVHEKKAPKEPPHEKRPASYTVEEGDTLYKIALRFYGRISAWKMIRDANKATISVDGRVNAGQTITLPHPEQ